MASLANINIKFSADLKQFSSQLQNAQRKINRMGKNMQKIGKSMTIGISAPILGIAAASLKAASELETLETSLAVMTGSAESGAKALKDLAEFTASTPFQLEQVGKAAKQLLAFGFSVDEVKEKLQTLGDVSAGSGNQIGDLAQIFGQVSAAGKLTGERFNQMQERAVPIGSAIAKTMGIAETSVKEFTSKGLVSFEDFEKAFVSLAEDGGLFVGAMEKQSRTLAGLFSTLKDNIQLAAGEMGNAIADAVDLQSVIKGFTEKIQAAVKGFKELSPETKKFIVILAGVAAAAGPLLALAGTILPAVVAGFGLLISPVGLVVAALTAIGVIIYKNWAPIKKTLVDIANYFVDLYNESTLFRFAVDAITFTFKNMWTTAKFVFGALSAVVKAMVTSFVNGFKIIGKVIKGALTLDADLIAEAWDDFKRNGLDTTATLIASLKKDWQKLNEGISDNLTKAIEGGGERAHIVITPDQIDTTAISNAVAAAVGGKKANAAGTAITGSNTNALAQPGIESDFTSDFKDIENINLESAREEMDLFIAKQNEMAEASQIVGDSVANAFATMSNNFIDSLGLADSGFEGFVKSLAKSITQLIAQLLSQAVAFAILGGVESGASTGAGAIVSIPVMVAALVGTVISAFASIPAFAEGGIIGGNSYHGDKLLARVNSGEAVFNIDQQRKMLDMYDHQDTNTGIQSGSITFEIEGTKLIGVLKNTTARNRSMGGSTVLTI